MKALRPTIKRESSLGLAKKTPLGNLTPTCGFSESPITFKNSNAFIRTMNNKIAGVIVQATSRALSWQTKDGKFLFP
jgi:hypothetical protein